ncbi:MAG: TolC family protein [Desulfobacterales bacterium]
MKILIHLYLLRTYIFIFSLLVISGCYSGKKYSYDHIQNEYADMVCRLSAAENSSEKGSCILDGPITLKEAVQIALANNPDNNMAAARIRKAEAMFSRTDSLFYPYLGFYTEYSQGDAPSSYLFKTIDQRMFAAGTDFNYPGHYDNFETGVRAGMNVYNGGRDILQRRIAGNDLDIQRMDRRAVENALVASVIQSYYNLLAAQDYIKIATESVATVSEQLRIMMIRFEGGSVLKSDILSLKVRLAQANEDLVRSNNQQKIARAVFANLLGVSVEKDIILRQESPSSIPLPNDFSFCVLEAIKNRPELKKVRKNLEKARMSLDIARSGYLPTVDIQGKYYFDDSDFEYEKDRENWMAAIVLNWDIFTGFSTKSNKETASAALEELLAADRKTLLEVKLDVKTAYLRLEEAEARLEVARSSVEMAEESLQLVKKQYDGGSVTITRYLEAELTRNSARTRSTAAYYDREKAYSDVGRAVGLFVGNQPEIQF